MWQRATSSELLPRPLILAVALAAALARIASGAGGALITVEEALALAFPGAGVERETVFLTENQLADVAAATGATPPGALVTRWRASAAGAVVGWAYLDTHRVRTQAATLLVVVACDQRVRRVEVVAFREPREYLPPASWYRQFDGETLSDELAVGGAIRPITGATLTAGATADAVRRALAIHRVLEGAGDGS